jgi:hypothetical protein
MRRVPRNVRTKTHPFSLEIAMPKDRLTRGTMATWMRTIGTVAAAGGVALTACSSSSSGGSPPGDDASAADGSSSGASSSGSSGSSGGDAAACANPGEATPGPADMHCATAADDGGALVQPVTPASCCIATPLPATCTVDAGDDGSCPYGATMWGMEGDDDDCKYHVVWTSGPICTGSAGVPFTIHVTNKTDGSPLVSDANTEVRAEVFTTTPGDAGDPSYCDDNSTHPAPGSEFHFTQSTTMPGYWSTNVVFDQAGQWTVRFHIHEECLDVLDDSPHGHAAFYVTVN